MNPNEHIKKTKPCFRFAYGVSKERLSCFLDILNQNRIRHRLRSKPIHVADIDFQTGNITFTDEYQQLWTIYIYEEDLQKVISHTQHLERYSSFIRKNDMHTRFYYIYQKFTIFWCMIFSKKEVSTI